MNKLNEGKVSVNVLEHDYDGQQTNDFIIGDSYNVHGNYTTFDPLKEAGPAFAETNSRNFGEKFELCVNIYPLGYEQKLAFNTESNIKNMLGIHEFHCHGEKRWHDERHAEILQMQMEDPSWQKTTEYFKGIYFKLKKLSNEYR